MRVVLFIVVLLQSFLFGSDGVSVYSMNSKSFSFANLGTTRANNEKNTKSIMTTYSNLLTNNFSIFNNFPDDEINTTLYPNNLGTHYLYSPEDFHYTKETSNTLESLTDGESLGDRTPIILVHGWQGDIGTINPTSQIEKVDSPEEYWHNLITFFTEHHKLKSKYKIYVYKYPSYKHVSFNGQILKNMLSDENIIPELKDKKIVFISHSMGAIVVRSAFEEHNLLVDKAEKIFFLAGVHHGSPASIPNLVPNNTKIKELNTLGANDIQWDNYDEMLNSFTKVGTSENDIIFENINSIFNINILDYDSELSDDINEVDMINSYRTHYTFDFDTFFRNKVENIKKKFGIRIKKDNNIKYILPFVPNPWLTHLNETHKKMNSIYKNKLFFYAGVNSNGTFINNNKLDDTGFIGIAEDGVSHLGELLCISNCYGYLNDGPVPMTSALLDFNYSFDKLVENYNTTQVRVYQDWILSDDASVKYYSQGSSDYIGDGYSKHVLFMDYHHGRMKSGAYSESDSSLSYQTGFNLIEDRKLYIKNASKNKIVPNDSELYSIKKIGNLISEFKQLNTIKYEPLFLSIAYELNGITNNTFLFTDVKNDDWYYPYVKDLFDRGTLTDKTKFLPDTSITKAEFLKIACELNNFKKVSYTLNFDDVGNDDWFYDYVMFASSKGWIDITKRSFEPNKKISRAEASQIIVNILDIDKCTSTINFSDVSENDWYFNPICILNEEKIVKGYENNTFKPTKEINRASASKILSLAFPKDKK